MIEQAIVLAGAESANLGFLTRDRTVGMLPVIGKPIVARVVERLHRAGVRRFVVVLGEQEGQIASYLHQSGPPDAEIVFVVQSSGSLGMAGALAGALAHLRPREPFLFTEADILTATPFLGQLVTRFEQLDCEFVVALCQAQFGPRGAFWPVTVRGEAVTHVARRRAHLSSTQYGMVPLFACRAAVAPYLSGRLAPFYVMDDFSAVLNTAIASGKSVGYALGDWYGRLNTPTDVLTLNRRWLVDEGRDAHILSEIQPSVIINAPVRIDPRVSIGPRAVIGPNVYLESGSTVGPGAAVSESVVLNGGYVLAGEEVRDRIVTRYASVT